jgi:SAM-dependent methyltransferase
MAEQSAWMQKVAADPGHSSWYVERFRSMAAAGRDLAGEARLIDAMVDRGARILDAGCGPGRVASELARLGHDVVGVDVDPVLIEAAVADHPGPRWIVEDLAELDLSAHGISEPFDAIVCAGNVMTFLAPSTRPEVLRRLRGHVRAEGRVVIGFGAGRGYEFATFLADARRAGLEADLLLSTWDLRPWRADADFLVAVLRPGQGAGLPAEAEGGTQVPG